MTEFKDVKQAIVEAQLAATPRDKLVNDIMKGSADLLSANDIITRLGISADEFKELVNLPNHYLRTNGGFGATVYNTKRMFDTHIELINQELEKNISFPKPDLYILGKARWKKETFKKWLEEQCK
ncbi:hypothetical protein P9Z71_10760 [Glaesserella parasuis]|uniref:hypothetical protein n=1 Tax=Glaesserella parasuis TaxID=738 RepID=UPI0021BED799|nr:hypothetical protein [Glaesserella parasuis]MCT8761875.1 hypothetical protein [Glaesserella parasuis]MCT8767533.1 hypothetical protein [Glaesserella parasuis]MDG6310687.1 hypothetical protein [Glaesserella parasuis]